MHKGHGLRRATVLALALLITAVVPAGTSAGNSEGNHCIFPGGTDFNEVWGVSEAIVWFNCTTVGAGQDWRVGQGWGMEATFKKVPKGFVPAGATPLDDFLAKFVGVKYVVDPGTARERVYRFTDVSRLLVGPGAAVNGVTMGTMNALSVGSHAVEAYWTMSATHCDGFVKGGCLPAGDSLAFASTFEVTPSNN